MIILCFVQRYKKAFLRPQCVKYRLQSRRNDCLTVLLFLVSADRHEIGHRLGSGGARGVHRATRDAPHRSNAARHIALLPIADGDRRRRRGRRDAERRLRSQADAEPGASVDNEPATPVRGLSRHPDRRRRSHHGHASSARQAAKGWSPAFR